MSLEARSSSALFKRAEQLKRWEESDTNREPTVPKHSSRRIKFSSGCVFLAACAAGDKDEVLKMLDLGADIDTANVDGLTALHQACIDDNLDMVEFLVKHGADVNRGDNEGWTPLHATASCGFVSIARYLLEHEADSSLVNNDGELALDIAEADRMRSLLHQDALDRGLDCEQARRGEELMMLDDAREWLKSGECADRPHPRTGATAVHVAAAKGYTKVLSLLLPGWPDVNCQDNDGWTPLHAAAHWSQKQAALLLVEALADMDMKNYVGQTSFDVADSEMRQYLEELKLKQSINNRDLIIRKKQAQAAKRRPQQIIAPVNNVTEKDSETPNKLIKVDLEIKSNDEEKVDDVVEMSDIVEPIEIDSELDTESTESTASSCSYESEEDDEKKNKVNSPPVSPTAVQNSEDHSPQFRRPNSLQITNQVEKENTSRTINSQKEETAPSTDSDVVLRRTQSFEADDKFYRRYMELHARIKASSCPSIPTPPPPPAGARPEQVAAATVTNNNIVQRSASLRDHRVLRRAAMEAAIAASTAVNTTAAQRHTIGTTTPSIRSPVASPAANETPVSPASPQEVSSPSPAQASPGTPTSNKLTPGNIFKNFFKSFVPPVRDEESETQRKAHAKRVRETRRSTQGVTLDEIKSAEQLVKKKNNNNNNEGSPVTNNSEAQKPETETNSNTDTTSPSTLPGTNSINVSFTTKMPANSDTSNSTSSISATVKASPVHNNHVTSGVNSSTNGTRNSNTVNATITPVSPVRDRGSESPSAHFNHERRPSWRLKVDNGSKFKLEDATRTSGSTPPDSPGAVQSRRSSSSIVTSPRPTSAPPDPHQKPGSVNRGSLDANRGSLDINRLNQNAPEANSDATVTLQLRRPNKSDDKEQDKENDVRNAQATQAVIQRRRRPKRRSTGVVNLDMDELDPDKQDGDTIGGDGKTNESGSERSSRSRLGSASSLADGDATENGDMLDYKALWETAKADNERLQEQLKKRNEELKDAKATIDRVSSVTNKNSLSESEKRERRAMERKLSEMEEELKQLEFLKSENQRLKDENGALIRVISKLSK